ncbi:unnamed protein product [Adineta steineri]|uniref:Uncharacterized protein n=1 Tax=Adineta steineri TaxID=433720 RepID=A0A813WAF7_9BILA|nr:unnamed protein product [Adineta steineri]
MTWSGFRPSDDPTTYGYLIPSNMMASVVLEQLTKMISNLFPEQIQLLQQIAQLRADILSGLNTYGVTDHPKYGKIYAYETDGFSKYLLVDDANVPSLLSASYFDFKTPYDPSNKLIQSTRQFVLSKNNTLFFEGKYASGIGSQHTQARYVWPMAIIMEGLTMIIDNKTKIDLDYVWERLEVSHADTFAMHESIPVAYTGMTWSGFRPSDDPTTYGYLIPSNMMASVVLEQLTEMILNLFPEQIQLLQQIAQLRADILSGLNTYGVTDHPKYGKIYAYETDGFFKYLLVDDANVPSLLSASYFDFKTPYDPSNKLIQSTRQFVLSKNNTLFFEGKYASGIGSQHTQARYVWPMAIIMEGLTMIIDNKTKIDLDYVWERLEVSHADTFAMHESFNVDNPKQFSRPWFAWVNSLFSELILTHLDHLEEWLRYRRPANLDQRLSNINQRPPNIVPRLPTTSGRPSNIDPQLSNTSRRPPNIDPRLPNKDRQPSHVDPRLSNIDPQLSNTSQRSPNLDSRLSNISGRPPNIDPLLPTTSRQLSNIDPRLPAKDQRPFNIDPRLPNKDRRPSDVDPRLFNKDRHPSNTDPRLPNKDRRPSNTDRRSSNID